jgi:UDP-glucose:(heptosyl)LPS alpha-1,3-glucosyltransferase
MKVIQVVKNFGPIGGMEEYVFNLSKELASQEIAVTVLCERQVAKAPLGIQVVVLGKNRKPHWISHFRFSSSVDRWLHEHPEDNRIIHSHERQKSHHLTTFHTTPFGGGKRKKLLHRVSPRHLLYEYLERRELMGPNTKAIITYSSNHRKSLLKKHPKAEQLLSPPIGPGVSFGKEIERSRNTVDTGGGRIGFIGKEWKRKGLGTVLEIWRTLKKERPKLQLAIAGVRAEEITHLFRPGEPDVEILGWIDDKLSFYQSIDLLLHPAHKEAFGMVITEAMTAGIPVLCSTECGASELVTESFGTHMPVLTKTEDWVNETSRMLSNVSPQGTFLRSWKQVASEHLEIYRKIMEGRQ